MAYSSIKPKKGKCIDCTDGKDKYLKAGRCDFHYNKFRSTENAKKKKNRDQVKKPLVKMDGKTLALIDLWFIEKEAIVARNPYCMECGAPIPPAYYRHAVAHIFPKSKFPSVATATHNFLILGAGCGCHEKSHTILTFSKMKVWPIAVQRFYTFESQIQESHKYLDLFKSYIV